MLNLKSLLIAGAAVVFALPAAASNEHESALRALAKDRIYAFAHNQQVLSALKSQNHEHASLAQGDIDAMDKTWRAETSSGGGELIGKVLGSQASSYLKGVKESGHGLFTEIFVMDNRGLNVAQSDITSDYWQGDEAKWKKTFMVGPDAVHVGDVEFDESSQTYQSQVSMAITDPDTKAVVGAITVGVNIEAME